MPARYVEVSLVAPGETAEAVSHFLFTEGALGLVTEDLPGRPERIRIRASFAGAQPIDPLVERLRQHQEHLAALGFSCATGPMEMHEVPAQDWGRVWMDAFPPLSVGQRLLVIPPWVPGPFPEDRAPIRILPAMTFGNGYDATTRLCLEALEAFMDQWTGTQGPNVLDLGTGTGILAIAENTVKNHLKNILEKLHLENRVQAATFALREGLLDKPPGKPP